MSVETQWLITNRLFYHKVTGDFDLDDVKAVSQMLMTVLDQTPYQRVHSIFDASEQLSFPSLKELNANAPFFIHPKFGWMVGFGFNRLTYMIGVTSAMFFKARAKVVKNLDEALDFLNEYDSELPPLRSLPSMQEIIASRTVDIG